MVEIAKPTNIRKMGVRGAVIVIPYSAIALLEIGSSVYLSEDGDDLIVSSVEIGTPMGTYKVTDQANVHIPSAWGTAHGFVPRKRIRKFLDEMEGHKVLRLRIDG
jgi:hypothetical protein